MPLDQRIEELRSFYADVTVKVLPDRTLVRIRRAILPKGCIPPETEVLLQFHPGQNVPNAWSVKEAIKLPNGNMPNFSSAIIDGEVWYTCSYRFNWNPENDPLYQYVESALHRFAKTA